MSDTGKVTPLRFWHRVNGELIACVPEAALAKARKEGRKEVREALEPIRQILDLEIERCQQLGDVWAVEGIDAEFPTDPDDRARFFHGQRDKLKELRADLFDSLTKEED